MLFTHLVGIQISFICGAINLEADVRRLTRRFPKSVEAEAVQKSSFTLGLFFLPLHQHNYITITAKLRECTRNSNDGIESTVYTLNPFGHKTRSKCLQRKKERVICLFSYFYSIDRSAEHIAILCSSKTLLKKKKFPFGTYIRSSELPSRGLMGNSISINSISSLKQLYFMMRRRNRVKGGHTYNRATTKRRENYMSPLIESDEGVPSPNSK